MKKRTKTPPPPLAETALKRHFGRYKLQDLVTSSRTFPMTARVDVQLALEKLIGSRKEGKLLGVHRQFSHETLTFANLLRSQHDPAVISPLQHEEVDIGDALPVRCLRQAIWLSTEKGWQFALLLSSANQFGRLQGTHVEIAVPAGETGAGLSRRLFDELDALVKRTASYRGKVISLEQSDRYSGQTGLLRVHKLRSVRREDVILPEKTLQL